MITFTSIVVYMPWLHVKLEPQTTGSKSQRLIFTLYADMRLRVVIDAVRYEQRCPDVIAPAQTVS
jgi:hypothetical protein